MDLTQLEMLLYGFVAGLVVAAYAMWSGWRARRELDLEVKRLRRHLHDHMEVTHEGARKLKDDLEELKRQNENLRMTLQVWQQKPDRRELRTLQIYEHALKELLATAPGFPAYWENAQRQAEATLAQADRGLLALGRRLLLPSARRREEPNKDSE